MEMLNGVLLLEEILVEVFTPQKWVNAIPSGLREESGEPCAAMTSTPVPGGDVEKGGWRSCQGGTEGLVYSRKPRGYFSQEFISFDPRLSTTQGTGIKDRPSSHELPTSFEWGVLGALFQVLDLEILRVSQ